MSLITPKKVLILGGASKAAVNGLVPKFDEMARLFYGKDHGIALLGADIEGKTEELHHHYGVNGHILDVTQTEKGWDILDGVDVVFNAVMAPHLDDEPYPITAERIHEGGTKNLLHFAELYGVRRIVHFSTFSVYSDPLYRDIDGLTEDLEKFPPAQFKGDEYGSSKWKQELILMEHVAKAIEDGKKPIEIAVGVHMGITSTVFPSWEQRVDEFKERKKFEAEHLGEPIDHFNHHTHVLDVGQFNYRLAFCRRKVVFSDQSFPFERYFCTQRNRANTWSIDKALDPLRLGYDPEYSFDKEWDKSGTVARN